MRLFSFIVMFYFLVGIPKHFIIIFLFATIFTMFEADENLIESLQFI